MRENSTKCLHLSRPSMKDSKASSTSDSCRELREEPTSFRERENVIFVPSNDVESLRAALTRERTRLSSN